MSHRPPTTVVNNPTTAILLVYYPDYAKRSELEFLKFLSSLPGTYRLVVVNNNPDISYETHRDIHVVQGVNTLREFSGWDAGLEYCESRGWLNEGGIFIFANDTFCHHNKFATISKFCFRSAFERAIRKPDSALMVGEKFRLGLPYCIDGMKSDAWISTYLFALTAPLIRKIRRFSPPDSLVNYYSRNAEKMRLSDRVSDNLARHIEGWLGGQQRTRWNGLDCFTENTLTNVMGKANSIICEKRLSALVQKEGGMLVGAFDSLPLRKLRYLDAIVPKLRALVSGKTPTSHRE